LTTERNLPDLNDLRRRLTDEQRAILSAIWEHYRDRDGRILRRALHQRFGKQLVRASLEQLGGSIAFEFPEGGRETYGLTFLGILLTDQGEESEQLLVRYLDYVRGRFVSDPEIERLQGQEIEAALGLSAQQSHLLRLLIHFGHLWGNAASLGPGEWSVGVPYDIEDLPSVQDLWAYVRTRALKDYDPAVPVNDSHRIRFLLSRAQIEGKADELQFKSEAGKHDQIDEPSRPMKWDVFICHASEDKRDLVDPLASALKKRGASVWYDRWVLNIGDSLRRSIDEGLRESRFGVVVLSVAFFAKNWPKWELDGLVQREVEGRKVILPIWHKVGHEEVARYSLPLADRVAGSTEEGVDRLADRLMQIIKATSSEPQATMDRVGTPASPVVLEITYTKLHISQSLHRYGLKVLLGLSNPPAKEGFRLRLLWPSEVRVVEVGGLVEGQTLHESGIAYREFILDSSNTVYPGERIEVFGPGKSPRLIYEFDDKIYDTVEHLGRMLRWSLYFRDQLPVTGEVDFRDLNFY